MKTRFSKYEVCGKNPWYPEAYSKFLTIEEIHVLISLIKEQLNLPVISIIRNTRCKRLFGRASWGPFKTKYEIELMEKGTQEGTVLHELAHIYNAFNDRNEHHHHGKLFQLSLRKITALWLNIPESQLSNLT